MKGSASVGRGGKPAPAALAHAGGWIRRNREEGPGVKRQPARNWSGVRYRYGESVPPAAGRSKENPATDCPAAPPAGDDRQPAAAPAASRSRPGVAGGAGVYSISSDPCAMLFLTNSRASWATFVVRSG